LWKLVGTSAENDLFLDLNFEGFASIDKLNSVTFPFVSTISLVTRVSVKTCKFGRCALGGK
jgi:hypothetical protein